MIEAPKLVWGAVNWIPVAASLAGVLLALLVVGYWRSGATPALRWLAGGLKAVGILILVLCLLEPLFSGTRARPGANQFVLLADNSQSMTLHDRDADKSRSEQLKAMVGKTSPWLAQLGKDFDVRAYAFDAQLKAVGALDELPFDGKASNLVTSIDRLAKRFQGRPLAGVMLFTDGSATPCAGNPPPPAQPHPPPPTALRGPPPPGLRPSPGGAPPQPPPPPPPPRGGPPLDKKGPNPPADLPRDGRQGEPRQRRQRRP